MKEIGLQPSNTGMVGGKETGQRMMDYIIPDGAFTKAFAELAATGWKLNLQSAHRAGGKKAPSSKTKVHLPIVRSERVGQTRPRDYLHALRARDAGRARRRGCGADFIVQTSGSDAC
jgi:hypothetical protein